MTEYILARGNGRSIPHEDKIFGINSRAKAMIAEKGADKVINATIGSLLDDEGNLVVLSSVDKVFKGLSPRDYADYAPIGGIATFKEAVQRAAFGANQPKGYVEAVATPGGTGSLRNVISNYSNGGDKVLTSDWHWAPYNTIAGEIGRSIDTFEFFTGDGDFNVDSLEKKVRILLELQESLVLILNTPAHNPTGYSLTLEDWDKVIDVICDAAETGKAIALVIDGAYIDFAGDEEEYRRFLPKLERLPENVISIMAYSLSKTFTLYGTRCGAMICIAKTQEIANEFKMVCEYSSRGSWSNSAKVAQVILSRIYGDPKLLRDVNGERAHYREMLLKRGRAFTKAADQVNLKIVPFDAGFFISIPCDEPDKISAKLEKEGLFIVPLAKGLRVSIASISEEKCSKLPGIIKAAM
ncbi:MAG: aminotransferase class I/II-fold pyridoxal phosphate-dependent enzyme [Clostridiales bacterium]|nr:aminotransferase class I/II-fold pyridoxal phosphate-dependent enzyme [Clostridiales bacterium]